MQTITNELFSEPVLSPLASAIQDHLLFRREHGMPPIMNEELCEMMNTKMRAIGEKGKVNDRAVRAAATELTMVGVLIVNDLKTGYKITTDKKEVEEQNARDGKAALSLMQKRQARKRAIERNQNYNLHDELEQIIQESIAETAERLK